jgi:hypothetical protein
MNSCILFGVGGGGCSESLSGMDVRTYFCVSSFDGSILCVIIRWIDSVCRH